MTISWSKEYIETNSRFELIYAGSRPGIRTGEMTIVYECLKRLGPRVHLGELVQCCLDNGYRDRFKNPDTDPTLSVLYQLNLMSGKTKRGLARPVVREALR
jgi:hypothetical protein